MDKDIKVTLKVWRQRGPKEKGQFETYPMEIHQSVSFLEMLDPRRYLRYVLVVCEWTSARTGYWRYDVPALYAPLPRWRNDYD